MDFRVQITGPAIADLAEIVSYISQDNAEAAKAVGNNLLDAALSLGKAPFKGRVKGFASRGLITWRQERTFPTRHMSLVTRHTSA